MSFAFKLITLFLAFGSECQSANILYFYPIASPSHNLWNSVLANELARVGHNVTYLSLHPPPSDKPENLHYIFIENVYELAWKEYETMSFEPDYLAQQSDREKVMEVFGFCKIGCKCMMNSPKGLDIILNYPDTFKFDLIINDFTCGPCFLPLVHKFNYPSLIGVTPFNNPSSSVNLIGGHKYPSYVPHYVNNSPQSMNFIQRLHNNFLYWVEKL
jgi:glucuronosyltransferase